MKWRKVGWISHKKYYYLTGINCWIESAWDINHSSTRSCAVCFENCPCQSWIIRQAKTLQVGTWPGDLSTWCRGFMTQPRCLLSPCPDFSCMGWESKPEVCYYQTKKSNYQKFSNSFPLASSSLKTFANTLKRAAEVVFFPNAHGRRNKGYRLNPNNLEMFTQKLSNLKETKPKKNIRLERFPVCCTWTHLRWRHGCAPTERVRGAKPWPLLSLQPFHPSHMGVYKGWKQDRIDKVKRLKWERQTAFLLWTVKNLKDVELVHLGQHIAWVPCLGR